MPGSNAYQSSQRKEHQRYNITFLLFFTLIAFEIQTKTLFKVTAVTQDFFQKVYKVNHNTRQYFLIISCKEKDMLSISISETREFQQSPRFNIYGGSQVKPKMGLNNFTFLKECHAVFDVKAQSILQIRRTKDSASIFSLNNITFRNLHNTFRVNDQSTKWGLGERFQTKFRVTNGKWTIWNRDKPWKIDRGAQGLSQQTYGHQPVYLARQKQTNLYHLAYFKSTHGLLLQISKDGDQLLFNSVGGNIHFIILLGQFDPQQVLQRFHDYIGRSHIPPFWSMGYHQCRWGYKTGAELNQVLTKFKENDLPIDTIWSDLDYMDQKMIFTVNPSTHKNLNDIMRKHDVHFVPLLDVGVSIKDSVAMDKGKQLDIFLGNPRGSGYYTGEVWPGQVHFVDYLHPKSSQFWKSQLKRLYDQVKFSGIWLDMNEPSNFRGNQPTAQPFMIQQNEGINQMTINVDIPHYSTCKDQLYHRQVHAYFGHLSTVPTYQFFKEMGQRPFIISRSNSVGTGQFAGHWTGDNVADWQFLRLSISGNFLFQIFGIQMVGSDICGFHLDTTEQLCSRWMQLGSFYPFMRNHNEDQPRSQQPYSFGNDLLETSRISLKTRYALLKQIFTIMVMKKGKGSFFKPIGFQFYQDENAFEEQFIQTQYMIGKGLMVTPIVYQNKSDRQVYFPSFPSMHQMWYSFKIDISTGKVLYNETVKYQGGTKSKISNPLPSAPPIFLRSGYSILTNKPDNRATKLNSEFHLFAALKNGESFTQILGIEDYNNQTQLSQCIEKGCSVYLSLKKRQKNNFVLNWNFQGSKNHNGKIKLLKLVAIQNNQKWSYEKSIQISKMKGQFKFEAKAL